MSYGTQAAQYRETQVLTASPAQLVVVLYDHLLVCLRRAHIAIEAGDMERRIELLHRARLVVGELLATLDHTQGGEIASNLSGLYTHMLAELLAIGRHADVKRLHDVVNMATELRSAFAQIAGEDAMEVA
jgi:flagellar secretion chaperone FliS